MYVFRGILNAIGFTMLLVVIALVWRGCVEDASADTTNIITRLPIWTAGGLITPVEVVGEPSSVTNPVCWLEFANSNDCSNGFYVDSSAYGNDGTQSTANARGIWTTNGIDFDGVDDYVSLLSPALLRPSNAVSVATWLYVDSWGDQVNNVGLGGNYAVLTSPTRRYGYSLGLGTKAGQEGTLYMSFGNGLSVNFYSGGGTGWVHVATWAHVAGTFDGTNLAVYVDGVLMDKDATGAADISYDNAASYVGIAKMEDSNAIFNPLDGTMDEVQIFGYALTSNDVWTLFNEGH